jgi:hypothetical protein
VGDHRDKSFLKNEAPGGRGGGEWARTKKKLKKSFLVKRWMTGVEGCGSALKIYVAVLCLFFAKNYFM